MFEIIIITIALILALISILGSVLPGLPGPVLGFIGLVLFKLLIIPDQITNQTVIILGCLTGLSLILNYILPLLGTKIYGISKQGTWGSMLGLIIGLIFFPPFGSILGLAIGAIAGELIAGKQDSKALKAGFISFFFSLLTIIYELSLNVFIFFYLIFKII